IEKSAERAAALTGQLLAFSRQQVLMPKVLAVDFVVTDILKLLRRLIPENIQLVSLPGENVGHVCADPNQLEQVILNLAVNARDAMTQGGMLLIETKNVSLSQKEEGFSEEFKPGEYVRLSLSDNGSGMTAETMSHLFEPFFTTKNLGKGTGLGLSIVYGVVRQSGGEITVASELGKGTLFHIYLPRVKAPETRVLPFVPAPSVDHRGRETILLVEDEEIVREMLAEVLRAQGYSVLEAKHGPDAVDLAWRHKEPIHLLITDMLMPGMNGIDLAARLITLRPELCVLCISGYSDEEARKMGTFDGVAEFLQKPFRPDVLLAKVREILDQKKSV
ncbi:MAG: ATP-binding protein, partial [Verrucomicrobiota bacterium]